MDIPFPLIYPPMINPDWFNADQPCDEDAELTKLEQANQQWLNSIAKKYMKNTPLVEKSNPVPTEEVVSDDDANDEADESEDSNDVEDEEDLPTTESPQIIDDEESENTEDTNEGSDLEVEITVWPQANQNE